MKKISYNDRNYEQSKSFISVPQSTEFQYGEGNLHDISEEKTLSLSEKIRLMNQFEVDEMNDTIKSIDFENDPYYKK